MSDRSAQLKVENLFISYGALFCRKLLRWIASSNQKLAIEHVLPAVEPSSIQSGLLSNLEFSHTDLKTDFNGVIKHCVNFPKRFNSLIIDLQSLLNVQTTVQRPYVVVEAYELPRPVAARSRTISPENDQRKNCCFTCTHRALKMESSTGSATIRRTAKRRKTFAPRTPLKWHKIFRLCQPAGKLAKKR